MSADRAIDRDGHRTWLKWHRGRRKGTDPVFTGRRILEAMTEGASVEVDLVVHADHGFAVLHDLTLERETTGAGPVRRASAATLRALSLRGEDGTPIADRVMLLEDLAALIAANGAHPDALLQLDYKEDADALDTRTIADFKAALAPVAHHFILSAGDAEAVRLLSDGVEGLAIGYDPCYGAALDRLKASRDWQGFVDEAIVAAPAADFVYLHHGLVTDADDAGFDIIAAFHAHGRRIDAYTIRRADAEGVALAERLIGLKADQITTDDPAGLGAALAR